MEIELTEAQAEKVETLKENGIEIGDAIDMFYQMKDAIAKSSNEILDSRIESTKKQKAALEDMMSQIDDDLSFLIKIKDSGLEPKEKQELVEKKYDLTNKTYDESVQDTKHHIKWSNFFKI